MQLVSALLSIAMVIVAWIYFRVRIHTDENGEEAFRKKLHDLLQNGFYLDQIYQRRIISPFRKTAACLWHGVDEGWVDGGLDHGARYVLAFAERLRLWTTGRVSQYVSMMITGFTLILCTLTLVWWVLRI